MPPPGTAGGRGGRPERHPRRLLLDAIFYLVRGGIAWAALPAVFPRTSGHGSQLRKLTYGTRDTLAYRPLRPDGERLVPRREGRRPGSPGWRTRGPEAAPSW